MSAASTDDCARSMVMHGARVNNLRGVDVDIPKRQLVVFTGVSGSGKSSLAFDTVAAESQRMLIGLAAGDHPLACSSRRRATAAPSRPACTDRPMSAGHQLWSARFRSA